MSPTRATHSGRPSGASYGARFEDRLAARGPDDLASIDPLVIIDLPRTSGRGTTFVWTAVLAGSRLCAGGVRVLVLDRPNPLGGDVARNRGAKAERASIAPSSGLEPIPVRHGLTLGEIVAWRASSPRGTADEARAHAWESPGHGADEHATAWDRPFVMPSPNMPTYETALVYPGGCLLEGTNLSEGRGTTRPFEIFGAPWLDGVRLAHDLHALSLPGFRARPLTFLPTFPQARPSGLRGRAAPRHRAAGLPAHGHVPRLRGARACAGPDSLRLPHRDVRVPRRRPRVRPSPPVDAEARERILRGERANDVAEAIASVDDADRSIVGEALEAGRVRRI